MSDLKTSVIHLGFLPCPFNYTNLKACEFLFHQKTMQSVRFYFTFWDTQFSFIQEIRTN